jgi:hypothetical protein
VINSYGVAEHCPSDGNAKVEPQQNVDHPDLLVHGAMPIEPSAPYLYVRPIDPPEGVRSRRGVPERFSHPETRR